MIVDVSGYSYSGKGAVMDVLRDFLSVEVHQKEFEFLLVRATDGLYDLRSTIVQNPSDIRNDMAIRRFCILTKYLAAQPTSFWEPKSLFRPPGQNYTKIFPGFQRATEAFIRRICSTSLQYWPFPALYDQSLVAMKEKWVNFFQQRRERLKFDSHIDAETFDAAARDYLHEVLLGSLRIDTKAIVTSNMLEFYNPRVFLDAIQPCKLVVVDRDPRGIYCSDPKTKDSFDKEEIACKFISDFRYYRCDKFIEALDHPNILRFQFEDLFLNFEAATSSLGEFLELERGVIRRHFSPEKSRDNFKPWKTKRNSKAIQLIEDELRDFLVL
ncbi:MAG: hypothetical protein CMF52_04655 [Legionellales bacterium]|nr:hypothetical protein [Legionellales bacterium]|tara:strand:- start:168 stop:1145 length:978 start_codon:yes stop_codon:yes gene_type:complete